ncbi:S8 family serine peptidase [Streptomyces amakusaensis]
MTVALSAGMAGPSSAGGSGGERAVGEETAGSGRKGLPGHRITLITGDRVRVDARGEVVGVEPAKGREKVPIHTRTGQGRTLVIPSDAQRLVGDGTLDERLFDITELNRRESRAVYGDGVKVIVGYRDTAAREAGSGIRAAAGTARTLASLNADAVTVPARDAAAFWESLTRTADGGGGRGVTAGVDRISLDGVYTARAAAGTARTAASDAHRRAGYDGTGVKIAVLDSGVDETHRDLAGRVVAERNFSRSPDSEDRYGQGTQVASVAAGSGAASNGAHRGVAPGAEVLSGKVLDDRGRTTASTIIAGIDWAVARGADIVNLSLMGSGRDENDPLETHVDRVTAERGVLFAVAAGDDGPDPRSIASPGRAEGALTVGAVDGQGRIAGFSAVGPREGGGVKPDLTAPGVDITAAAAPGTSDGQSPPGHVSFSGTAAATPHAAGVAALLKQRHPKWKAAELKSVLTGSAKNGTHKHTPFEQGAGRVAADRALEQRVFAERSTVTFGTQRYPHTDDTPVTRSIDYRNTGGEDLTLDLTVTADGPDGRPAPEGFFTLGRNRITVPAGGTASVELTADTRLGGGVNGDYAATVVASGGGQSVRTTAGVEREVESYDLTVRHIDRHGKPGRDFRTVLGTLRLDNPKFHRLKPGDESGSSTIRLPRGTYRLDSIHAADPRDSTKGYDWLSQPKLSVDRHMTFTVDARTTRPVDITPPDAKAKSSHVSVFSSVRFSEEWNVVEDIGAVSFKNFRTAHIGPDVTDGSLTQSWTGHWSKGNSVQYSTVHGGPVQRFATGHVKRFKARDMATVRIGAGASAPGKRMGGTVLGQLPHGLAARSHGISPQPAPGVRTLYLSAVGGATWELTADQYGKSGDRAEARYYFPRDEAFRAGKTYTRTVNTPVFAPRIADGEGVFREEDSITGALPVFSDGAGNEGWSTYSSVKTTLHRGKTRIGENNDPLTGDESFAVGPADAPYTLSTSVTRSPELAKAGSRIDASWTFRSKRPGTEEKVALPVSVARLKAAVSPDGTAPAGRTQRVPVTVQGAAAGGNLRSLEVSASYDHGRTWKKLPVTRGGVTVGNPAKGKAITFRSVVTDKKGNQGTVTLYDAYYGK